ncbi:MAG: leucine-rich repeat domain-containing protein, partial [Actinobacteria bacterium]|nr:leucine-rich repeat domain-containing protein [Actinomycetota bacterium]
MFERLGHRALSVCLSVILIFLCAPLSAFADESGSTGTDDSFAASTDVASQNEVVALGEFVALDETVSLCDTVASLSIAEAFTPPSGLVYLGSTRFSYGGLKYLITSGTDVQVCGYTADMPAELEIPSQIIDGATTYSVTSIGNSVFTNNQALVSIRIPASVTGIGYDAFMDCRSLTKVELPDSAITQIRQFTFSGCTSLSYFDFPTQLESIGANAFRSTAFETLVLPDSLTLLGSSAFAQNPKLSSVMFGTTLTGIGQSAFDQCPSLASIVFSGPRIAYDFG